MLNKKIIAIIVAVILATTVAGVGVFTFISSQNDKEDDVTDSTTLSSGEAADGTDITGEGAEKQEPLAERIIGTWRDSADMSGYKFYADGTVEMTYINMTVPVINMPINGTSKGVYTLEGNTLTTTFSIYSASIIDTYTVSVENNMITMTNKEDGDVSTYAKVPDDNAATDVTVPSATDSKTETDGKDIAGSWTNGDGLVKYVFNANGTATVTFGDSVYSGVYVTEDDGIMLQYTKDGEKVTQKYEYTLSGNNLTLRDGLDVTLLVRSGTALSGAASEELLGKWLDGAQMSGYEFKEGGVVKVTYVNITIPVINMPINGTYTGSYTINGDSITISCSIYGNNISDTYTFTVNNNVLTLKAADGNLSTYMKQ